MNFIDKLNVVLEKAQGDEIAYFVEFDDRTYLGWNSQFISRDIWFEGASFATAEEANRWAGESYSKYKKLWRLVKVDMVNNAVLIKTPLVNVEQAEYWAQA